MKQKRPNVLLLMTDQQRFDTLGFYGNDVIKTPNLDRIAAEGTVFTRAYTACPSCVPARASLMTGMSQWHTGILGMGRGQNPMGVGFKHTLASELAQAGYHTQGIGKMHFYPQRSLNGFHNTVLDESGRVHDAGFVSDYKKWFDENKDGDYDIIAEDMDWNGWKAQPYEHPGHLHPNVWTVDQSIEFLKTRDVSKPFFMKTSFARPHSPYDALPEYYAMYKDQEINKAWVGEWADMHDDPETAKKINAWRGVKSDQEIHDARAAYYGNISHIDAETGRLLRFMEDIGELDETLIIFTSDHGDMLGDHNMWRKTYAYEGSAHVPMLVRLPKSIRSGVQPTCDLPVMLRDIMPTVLETLGLEIPETVDGLSMLGCTYGSVTDWRPYVHGEHCTCYSEDQEMQYLTDGKIKYIWLPRLGIEQLFNLEDDPCEMCDLAGNPDHQDMLKQWRRKLISELEPRDAGLTNGDQLVCQKGKPPIVSPYYQKRLEESEFDWLELHGQT